MFNLAVIDPVAFSLGPIQVHWYGILIGTGALLGLWLATREAKRLGVDPEKILDMMIWVIPAAIIGARLYYVIFEWDYYRSHPQDIIAVWKGGLAIHGGLIGAFLAGYFFVKKHHLRFLVLADIVAPSIILGQAIGRWGNFVNQEAHGGPVSRSFLEGLHLPDWIIEQMNIQGTYYHPTFLYESLWNLIGFGLLLLMRKWNPKRGEIFFTYFMWYSLGRFFIEGLRTDSLTFTGPDWLASLLNFLWSPMNLLFSPGAMENGNIRVAQLVSFTLILFAIGMIVWRRKKGLAEESYTEVNSVSTQAQ
ncbi:prolipoprotein diacylglyceryl transferase [Thermoflavimicrobium dichotomicum]|uniref:Phosphatidylglycerol--prolipoprotein diacylglyceryl transferase n=1 Tax=Thermoflavimicrobium dichotomicum TaxID=46223 RepID=A0A1I3JU59_9BACL|nr:prolipoprotein diacylglyceryl transferase [Thermoflavimicrobium dichotomicum]SFI63724.1 phosphatidylglycerol:prolipoprotein diacylglycerol transferase [Thermoflavimicrobium dichotomicum]